MHDAAMSSQNYMNSIGLFQLTPQFHQLISSCVICQRIKSTPQDKKMTDVPEDRLTPAPPFPSLMSELTILGHT